MRIARSRLYSLFVLCKPAISTHTFFFCGESAGPVQHDTLREFAKIADTFWSSNGELCTTLPSFHHESRLFEERIEPAHACQPLLPALFEPRPSPCVPKAPSHCCYPDLEKAAGLFPSSSSPALSLGAFFSLDRFFARPLASRSLHLATRLVAS